MRGTSTRAVAITALVPPDSTHAAAQVGVQAALSVLLAALSSLLQVQHSFGTLLVFATVLDLVTVGWDRGRWVGLRRLPRRAGRDWGKRFAANLTILLVVVTIANGLPRLFGWAIEAAVAYAAVTAGSGTIDHVLDAAHPFRRTWARVMTRVERLWDPLDVPPPDAGASDVPPPDAPAETDTSDDAALPTVP